MKQPRFRGGRFNQPDLRNDPRIMSLTSFQRGQPILYREVDARRKIITDVKPVTVVEDSDTQVVLWLPLDTPSKKPVLHSRIPGKSRRWTEGNWSLQDSVWRWAELLIIIKPDQLRATWVKWSRERIFQGWYVNMQSNLVCTGLGFDIRDHSLDILVEPDREWRWKDEEELDICVEDGRIEPTHAKDIRAEGLRAVAEIESNEGPFSEGWEDWYPDPTFPRPELTSDWNDLSMYS